MTSTKEKFSFLQAGASQVDITPKAGIQLSGDVGRRPAKIVKDPLYAKALVLECNGQKLCFVALDITIIAREHTSAIRQAAAEKFGFREDAVMVHALQIHSAPSIGHFMLSEYFDIPEGFDWLRGGDKRYDSFAVERTIEAIKLANDSLQPVQVGVASGIEGRLAFNRRAIMRNGSVGMPWPWDFRSKPLGPTGIRYMEGPIDPELGVMSFQTDSLSIPAMLVNYTCHPVAVFGKDPFGHIVSADWPGALANQLKKAYGKESVPLILNGACGNINPWNPFEPGNQNGMDHEYMGQVLAEMTERVVEKMTFSNKAVLDYKVRHIKIPLREMPVEELENAQKVLEKNPEPIWTDDKKTRFDVT